MHLSSDLRLALRLVRRSTLPSAIVILTIGIGTGAVTALFGVVNGLFLRPLPFRDAQQLTWAYTTDSRWANVYGRWSNPADVLDWRSQAQLIDGVLFFGTGEATLAVEGKAERIKTAVMSADLDRVLGLEASVGRMFRKEEFGVASNVAVLEHGFWKRRFGGDRSIIGRTVTVDDVSREIVGVLPPLEGSFPSAESDIWLPNSTAEAKLSESRDPVYVQVVVRRKPGVSLAAAGAELKTIEARLGQLYPTNTNRSVVVEPYLDAVLGPVKPTLLLLAATVGLALLIACGNVGSLLLGRARARRQEFALRAAIGGSASRLASQLVTETLVLALAGGLLGVALAPILLQTLLHLYPGTLPRQDAITIDARVFAVAVGVAFIAGLLATLPVIRQASRLELSVDLHQGGRSGVSAARRRASGILVVTQVAVSMVLLIAGSLLLRTLWQLSLRGPGFEPHGMVAFSLSPGTGAYPNDSTLFNYFERVEERVRAVPGVKHAGLTTLLPYDEGTMTQGVWADDVPQTDQNVVVGLSQGVSAGYLPTLGLELVAGRLLEPADRGNAPRVAVINTALAKKLYPGKVAVGRSVIMGGLPREIVGIVSEKRHRSLRDDPQPEVFLPRSQSFFYSRAHWVAIRTDGPPAAVISLVEAAVREVDPNIPIAHLTTIEDRIASSLAPERFRGVLVSALSALAIALTIIGIYGTVAYLVTERTREIGLRIALGESPARVRHRILLDALKVSGIGVAIGVIAAWVTGIWLQKFLAGIGAHDPVTLIGAVIGFTLVTVLAAYAPALKASRLDPLIAIRAD